MSSKVLARVHTFYVPIFIHAAKNIIYIARIFRRYQLIVATNKVLTSFFDRTMSKVFETFDSFKCMTC